MDLNRIVWRNFVPLMLAAWVTTEFFGPQWPQDTLDTIEKKIETHFPDEPEKKPAPQKILPCRYGRMFFLEAQEVGNRTIYQINRELCAPYKMFHTKHPGEVTLVTLPIGKEADYAEANRWDLRPLE